jgi:hypothetical protein
MWDDRSLPTSKGKADKVQIDNPTCFKFVFSKTWSPQTIAAVQDAHD